uniref:Collagen alpha-1(X) chain-like n=1 Tax=Sinocyclocheilus anshuiensis TaxID=1608454 RepID=A0A671ST44_9TELE
MVIGPLLVRHFSNLSKCYLSRSRATLYIISFILVYCTRSILYLFANGAPGMPGHAGPKGPQGATGATGAPGIPGYGKPGEPGAKGERGVAGSPGTTGQKGEPGAKGHTGYPGATGPMGPAGPQGSRGFPGERGATGDKGDQGPMGPPGLKGHKGEQGPQGIEGKQGYPGATGQPGSRGVTGAPGNKGDAGQTGAPGTPGTPGPAGPKGLPGYPGAAGPSGPTGLKVLVKSPVSAFTVATVTPYPPSGTPIKFDQIVYNAEQHYDPETGLFTCQIPGIYYFSYSMHVNGANALVALYKNGDPVMFTYDEYNKGFVDQMSGSSVLQLNEQDTVYIQIPDDEANGVFAADNVHCSFSGFLIAST